MSGTPRQRHPLSRISNKTRKALKQSALSLGKQKFLPKELQNRLKRLGYPRRPGPESRRKHISAELKKYAQKLKEKKIPRKIIRDFLELAHYSYVFDINSYKSQLRPEEADQLHNIGDAILHYCVSGCKQGIDPSILFDTENYITKNPEVEESGINPMIHFFNIGIHERQLSMDPIHFMRKKADIKRTNEIITQEVKRELQKKKVGVFLHIFYPELAGTIANYLKNIPCNIDIFVSTKKGESQALTNIFKKLKNVNHIEVQCFQNIGRDVAPFIVGYRDKIPNYDYILKLHSKKSPHSNALNGWFLHCLDNLIGSETVTATNLNALEPEDTGIVYPVENYTISLGMKYDSCWGYTNKNYKRAQHFLKQNNLNNIRRDSCFDFPAGTMFWCKPEVLKPILNWNLRWEDFDEEAGQIDGTIAHSIERLIGISTT